MDGEKLIGQFLRARRALMDPGELGLEVGPRRRVSGLRREEVALPAGVSTDYYVRLEQGRERNPSAQVVEAPARALQLDEEAVAHLHKLAQPGPARRRRAPQRERVSRQLVQLMDAWPQTPALVLGRCLAVLAATPSARRCSAATSTATTSSSWCSSTRRRASSTRTGSGSRSPRSAVCARRPASIPTTRC